MSGDDPRDAECLTPAEEVALQALRQQTVPPASEALRARAREAFVQGTLRAAGAPRRNVVPLPRLALAAAAVLLLALFLYGSRPEAVWELARVHDPDGVLSGVVAREGTVLPPGVVTTPDNGEFDLALGDGFLLRMTPGTSLVLPAPPRRWFAAGMEIQVQRGEVFGTTRGRKLPASLVLRTPQANVQLTGTTFAVLLTDEGTCVCLLEGRVEVQAHDAATPTVVPEGFRCVVYADGRPQEILPIAEMERGKLQMLRDAAAGR